MTNVVKRGAGRPAANAKRKKHAQRDVVVGGARTDALIGASKSNQKGSTMAKEPAPRFTMLGKGKFVHVIRTAAWDRKNSGCQTLRKYVVAEKIDYSKKNKGLSPEAALALDGCEHCATSVVATRMLPADSKRAAAKDARDEVLDRASGKNTVTKEARKGRKKVKADKPKKVKDDKPKAERKPTATKSGVRSTGSDTDTKAKALAMFMTDNGWDTDIAVDSDTGHTVVHGIHADQQGFGESRWQVINAYFIDGKYDVARHATLHVGGWSGTLRGAHAVRRQVDTSLDDRDRPHPEPGKGRSGPRKSSKVDDEVPEDESPEDAARRVPFLIDDDEAEIIDALLGKTLRWRNGVTGKVEEAMLPSTVRPPRKSAKRDVIRITTHPKSDRRMVEFLELLGQDEHGEIYGPERTVALDKIVRVVG